MKVFLDYLLVMALYGGIAALPGVTLCLKKQRPARMRLLFAVIPMVLLLTPLPLFVHRCEYRTVPVLASGGELTLMAAPQTNGILPETSAVQSGFTALTAEFFVLLWAVGAFMVFLCQLAGGLSVRKFAQNRVPASKEAEDVLVKLCREMRLKTPTIAYSALTDTPLLTGLFRPIILLPAQELSKDELELVLRHELTHLKYRHLWLQAAARLTAALYWFHPAGWWLLRQLPLLCEEACDETVADSLPPAKRKQYGLVILQFAGAAAHTRCAALASPRQNMERRLKSVINPMSFSRKCQIIAAAAAALLLCGSCALSYQAAPTELKDGPDELAVSDLENPSDTSEDPKEPESSASADESSAPEAPAESGNVTEFRHPEDPASSVPVSEPVSELTESKISELPATNGESEETNSEPAYTTYQSSAPISAPYDSSHRGVDLKEEAGSEVRAYAGGTVVLSEYCGSRGNTVKIDHGKGLKTIYAHCGQLLAKVGDTVSAGDAIAIVGSSGMSTGPHLHVEAEKDGQLIDPTPLYWKAE